MKVGKKYCSPVVLKVVSFDLETDLLAGSVTEKVSSIKSEGQEVTQYNYSTDVSFNHEWEN